MIVKVLKVEDMMLAGGWEQMSPASTPGVTGKVKASLSYEALIDHSFSGSGIDEDGNRSIHQGVYPQ